MKIGPVLAPAPLPTPAGARPAAPGFGLLMEAGQSVDDGSRATGFQARGMFGRHGATPEAGSGRPAPVPAPAAESSAQPPRPILDAEPAVQGRPKAPPPSARSPDGPVRGPEPASDAARRAPAAAGTGEATPARRDASPGDEVQAGGTRPRRARAPAPAPPPPGQVSLGKADDLGAAHLIVRAAGLDPREIAEFRARAQILLRERGLALDKVRINGEDHPAVVRSGGSSQWP